MDMKFNNPRHEFRMATLLMCLGLAALSPVRVSATAPRPAMFPTPLPAQTRTDTSKEEAIYTCAMHPSVRQKGPGNCPICGMTLTPVKRSSTVGGKDAAVFNVSPAKQQTIGVKYDSAIIRPMFRFIRTVGNVEVDERKISVVNLRYSGWIESLDADYRGKYVNKGETLFHIYSPEVLSAQREYLLSRSFRNDTAWSVDGLLGGDDFDSSTRDKLRLLDFSEDQISALDEAGEAPRTISVPSPLSGFILEKMATAGMFVEPGMTLYTIADLSTVWLHAQVYQSDVPDVRTGQDATVRFAQLPGRDFPGKITFIYPVLDNTTRSVKVRIEISNHEGTLKPEMFGDVVISTNKGKRLSIPVNAVMQTGTREIVFVDRGNGDIEARIIRSGVRAGGYSEIISGLHSGERVISSANFLIDAESRIQGVLDRLDGADEGATPPPPHQH